MRRQPLGQTGASVPVLCQGCMQLGAGGEGAEAQRRADAAIEAALAAGIDHFDHADIYQRGRAETLFGTWLAAAPSRREQVIIQTKVGIRPPNDGGAACTRYDFSAAHITTAVDGCLARLRCGRIDVLLLHRPAALVEFDELARVVDDLVRAGKIRHLGVSNHSGAQMRLLARHLGRPLAANQLEFNPVHCSLVDRGLTVNRPDNPTDADGNDALEECRLQGVTIQAWSPLARGFLSGRPAEQALADERSRAKFPLHRVLPAARVVERIARERGVPCEAVVLAWILRHPAGIQPVIGTTDPARITACAQADQVTLSREEWYELLTAGRGAPLP